MSLSVKVYYQKEGREDPEIRRFAVDQDVSTNFEYLSRKVMQAFPELNDVRFSLQWTDSDGDRITFSSDEELMEALGCLQDPVFKIHLKVHTSEEKETRGEVHPGVECDGCSGSVCGTRFKCMVCPDYDLCAACEAKGVHTEHQMLRIRTPQAPGAGFMGFGPWGFFQSAGSHPPHGHPPPPPPPHGHPPPPPHGHPPPPHGHHPPPAWDPRAMPPHWRNWMSKCRANLWGWSMPFGGAEDASGQDMETDENQAGSTKEKPGKKTKTEDKTKQSSSEDYLKAVGAQVAAMLDPLGIDVAVDIEHGSQRHRCGSNKGKGQGKASKKTDGGTKNSKPETTDVDMTEENDKPVSPQASPSKPETPKPESTSEAMDDWTMVASVLDGSVQAQTATSNTEPSVEPSAPAVPAPTPSPPPSAVKDETDGPAAAAPPNPPTPPANTGQNIYPNLPASHPDPRIAAALSNMLQMGFTDDGEWLTRLLVAKEGNISAVLDAMQPRK